MYECQHQVRYGDCNQHLQASAHALMEYVQETAVQHSVHAGFGPEALMRRHQGWMLVQARAEIHQSPPMGSPIHARTWPSDLGSFLSKREFFIDDQRGQSVMRATTLWAFVDTLKRRPTRIPSDVLASFPTRKERALEKRFCHPPEPDEDAPILYQTLARVKARQQDYYGHVNNLAYLDWMLDPLPSGQWRDYRLSAINIRFVKEITDPDLALKIRIRALSNTTGTQAPQFIHEVLPEGPSHAKPAALAIAHTQWQARS